MKKLFFIIVLILGSSAFAGDGRFQFIVNPQYRSESMLLDTQTGKLWQRTCIVSAKTDGGECQYSAWYPQDIVDITVTKKEIQQLIYNNKKD